MLSHILQKNRSTRENCKDTKYKTPQGKDGDNSRLEGQQQGDSMRLKKNTKNTEAFFFQTRTSFNGKIIS